MFNGFLRRIRKNYFDKKWEDRKPNFVDWRYIIQIIGFSTSEEEVLYYSTIGNKEKFQSVCASRPTPSEVTNFPKGINPAKTDPKASII